MHREQIPNFFLLKSKYTLTLLFNNFSYESTQKSQVTHFLKLKVVLHS